MCSRNAKRAGAILVLVAAVSSVDARQPSAMAAKGPVLAQKAAFEVADEVLAFEREIEAELEEAGVVLLDMTDVPDVFAD